MPRNRRGNLQSNKHRSFSTIKEHHIKGRLLVPPLANLPSMQPSSWLNERLLELLWVALLISRLSRAKALRVFRDLADYVAEFRENNPPYNVTHSAFAKLSPERLSGFFERLLRSEENKAALSPLLLLQNLPAREKWEGVLDMPPFEEGWNALAMAVAQTLDHQSQSATDCRWVRVLCMLASGKVSFPDTDEFRELFRELVDYPNYGDMRKVRPSIRAMELSLDQLESETTSWPQDFWTQCKNDTPCYPLDVTTQDRDVRVGTTLEAVKHVYEELSRYFDETSVTTDVDARHETVFGLALFCVGILQELMRIGVSQSIMGRLALRTIGEAFITLSYLIHKDDPELWRSYRVFGSGQAKLSYLKLEESGNNPK